MPPAASFGSLGSTKHHRRGEVERAGRISITTRIGAGRRNFATGEACKVTEAIFTYIAIGGNRGPRLAR
jgi:acyl-CoA hydrolase